MAISLGSAISYLINSSHVIFDTSIVTWAGAIELATRETITGLTNRILLASDLAACGEHDHPCPRCLSRSIDGDTGLLSIREVPSLWIRILSMTKTKDNGGVARINAPEIFRRIWACPTQ